MRYLVVAAALTAATFSLPAWAQNNGQGATSSQTQGQQGTSSGHHHMNQARIEHELRQQLTKAGFTDIRMMPESFLVRAKNAEGLPVMMVINPDSVTEVTAMGAGSGHAGTSRHGNAGAGTSGTVGGNAAGKTNQQ